MESSKKRNRITKGNEAGNKPFDDLLKSCKPLSVNMTRLPASVVIKYTATSTTEKKNKKRVHKSHYTWKQGWHAKPRKSPQRIYKARQIGGIPKTKNSNVKEDTATESRRISDDLTASSNEHDEVSLKEVNTVNECREGNIDRSESEAEGSELTSSGHEAPSVTESRNASLLATVGSGKEAAKKVAAVEESTDNIPHPRFEQIVNGLSRNRAENRTAVRDTAKRKRFSQPHDEAEAQESERLLRGSKRHKSTDPVTISEEKILPKGKNIETPRNDVVSVREQVKRAKSKRRDPKSVRRRDDSVKDAKVSLTEPEDSLKDVKVILTKLEDSLDPLIRRWTEKIGLKRLQGDDATTRGESLIENRVEEQTPPIDIEEFESSKKHLKQTSPPKEPTIHTEPEVGTNGNVVPATSVHAVPETNNFTPLDEETRSSGVLAELQERSTIENEENDEEIMAFLRSPRKSRLSIDSSSTDSTLNNRHTAKTPMLRRSARIHTVISSIIDSTSDSEEVPTTRVLRSHAKTPSVIPPERTRPDTRMSRMLRPANTPAADTLYSERTVHQTETPKTRSVRHNATRLSIENSATDNETEASYEIRAKSRQLVIDDTSSESNFNPGEPLTDMYDDEASDSMPIDNQNSVEKIINTRGRETAQQAANIPTEKTANIADNLHDRDSQIQGKIEVHCDSSIVDDLPDSTNPTSYNFVDARMARKKLNTLNAMVVLTRVESLNDVSFDGTEFANAESSPWMPNFSTDTTNQAIRAFSDSNDDDVPLDPLEINEDHRVLSGEINNSTVGSSSQTVESLSDVEAVKSSLRKSSRVTQILTDDADTRCSQDTVESDVELSLVFEDGDGSLGDFLDQSQTSGIGESVFSGCTLTEGILTDANGNSSRHLNGHDGLDEQRKRCRCEDCQRDSNRIACQNIMAAYKCVACNGLFDDAELLKQHRASCGGANVTLRCTICRATYKTQSALTRHRAICAEKSAKRKSVIQSTTSEADTNSHTEQDNTTKTQQKKSQVQKKLSKKDRSKFKARTVPAICNVCSVDFVTPQALSAHIYTHSLEENQEAYRKIKATMLAESQANRSVSEKTQETVAEIQEAGSSTIANVGEGRGVQKALSESTLRPIRSKADLNGSDPLRTLVTVRSRNFPISTMICPCHQNDAEGADKNDLQIEMVLVCQYCQVLFRRRECFEVHYRTSPRCANDRTRGRIPRLYCANCQLTLETWKNMRHHLVVHANENTEGTVRFVCNICRVVFVGFGVLFYNHWFSHLKDTMFVASRYTFPKISVQPKDGLVRLPIGASVDETYIWVAEHVCPRCKKPFSTSPDLVLHQETDAACRKLPAVENDGETVDNEAQWYCDACDLVFNDRDKLNEHGVVRHDHHYTCVSTEPRQKTFMCTQCYAMRKRIKDMEDHWKTDPKHNSCRFDIATNIETIQIDDNEPAIVTPLGINNQNDGKTIPTNDVRGVSNSTLTTVTMPSNANQMDESQRSGGSVTRRIENDAVFQASVENSQSQSISCTDNQVSSSARPRTGEVPETIASSALDNSMNTLVATTHNETLTTSDNSEQQRSRLRALEDPSVNVVFSNSSSAIGSACLVIDESRDRVNDNTSNDSIADSYQILMMDNNPTSTSGPIKMVFGRKNTCNATQNFRETRAGESTRNSSSETVAEKLTSTRSTLSDANNVKSLTKGLLETTIATDTATAGADEATLKASNHLSNIPTSNETILSRLLLSNNQSGVPEVIDIVEEIELASETSQVPNNAYSSSNNKPSTTKSESKVKARNNRTSTTKKKTSQGNSSSSSMNSSTAMNDSGKSDLLDEHSQARRECTLSFEEARYAHQILSKNSGDDGAVSKKQGFLRVKNLSELQDLKKYPCEICVASFDSMALLDEHSRQHLQTSLGMYVRNRRDSLLSPNPSGRSKSPVRIAPKNLSAALPTQSYIPQRIVNATFQGVDNSVTGNSWIHIENPNTMRMNSQSNASKAPGTVLPNRNVSNDAAKSVATSTTSLGLQQNFSHQSQALNTSVGYIAVPDIHRQLSEPRNTGQIGYHILPAMVVPASQSNKQPIAAASQQNSSSNNLPTGGLNAAAALNQQQISNATQPAVSTVIVPQGSFRTVNDTATDGNAEAKSNNDRLVVNNWILQNPSINWPNTTFSQQSESTVLPITTQSLLTTAVNNSNGTGMHSEKSSASWTPPHSSNNSTSTLKQSAGWTSSAFNTGEIIGGQIIYQCKICKSPMYSDYELLRRHILVTHGIENFSKSRIESIVQKNYYCTRCPRGVEPFDSAAKLTMHQNTGHSNVCPTCGRTFHNYIYLVDHIFHCSVGNSTHGNFDLSC